MYIEQKTTTVAAVVAVVAYQRDSKGGFHNGNWNNREWASIVAHLHVKPNCAGA